jgi:hypothetical protein
VADLIADSPIVFFALVFAAVYLASCAIHPFKACKACKRSRASHSTMFRGAFGACRSCRGRGHHLRFGARLLGRKL